MERKTSSERVIEIADAALQIITKDGLSGFTTKKLAQLVGLSEGTIFKHFSSKDQIISASVDRLRDLIAKDATELPEGPIEKVEAIFRRRMNFAMHFPGYMELILSDELVKSGNNEIVNKIMTIRNAATALILSCFVKAKELGLLKDELDPDILIMILQGTVQAFLASKTTNTLLIDRIWKNLNILILK